LQAGVVVVGVVAAAVVVGVVAVVVVGVVAVAVVVVAVAVVPVTGGCFAGRTPATSVDAPKPVAASSTTMMAKPAPSRGRRLDSMSRTFSLTPPTTIACLGTQRKGLPSGGPPN
jgi:hypothetical protein